MYFVQIPVMFIYLQYDIFYRAFLKCILFVPQKVFCEKVQKWKYNGNESKLHIKYINNCQLKTQKIGLKEVDTKLLLHAIQKTAAFESLLSRRFTGESISH